MIMTPLLYRPNGEPLVPKVYEDVTYNQWYIVQKEEANPEKWILCRFFKQSPAHYRTRQINQLIQQLDLGSYKPLLPKAVMSDKMSVIVQYKLLQLIGEQIHPLFKNIIPIEPNAEISERISHLTQVKLLPKKSQTQTSIPKSYLTSFQICFQENLPSISSEHDQVTHNRNDNPPSIELFQPTSTPLKIKTWEFSAINKKKGQSLRHQLRNQVWLIDQEKVEYCTLLHFKEKKRVKLFSLLKNKVSKRYRLFPSPTLEGKLLKIPCELFKLLQKDAEFPEIAENKNCLDYSFDPSIFKILFEQSWYESVEYEEYLFINLNPSLESDVDRFLIMIDYLLGPLKNVSFLKNNRLYLCSHLLDELGCLDVFKNLPRPEIYPGFYDMHLWQPVSWTQLIDFRWFRDKKNRFVFTIFPDDNFSMEMIYHQLKSHPLIKELSKDSANQIIILGKMLKISTALFQALIQSEPFKAFDEIKLVPYYGTSNLHTLWKEQLIHRKWYTDQENPENIMSLIPFNSIGNSFYQWITKKRKIDPSLPEVSLKKENGFLKINRMLFEKLCELWGDNEKTFQVYVQVTPPTANHYRLISSVVFLQKQKWSYDPITNTLFFKTKKNLNFFCFIFNEFIKKMDTQDNILNYLPACYQPSSGLFTISYNLILHLQFLGFLSYIDCPELNVISTTQISYPHDDLELTFTPDLNLSILPDLGPTTSSFENRLTLNRSLEEYDKNLEEMYALDAFFTLPDEEQNPSEDQIDGAEQNYDITFSSFDPIDLDRDGLETTPQSDLKRKRPLELDLEEELPRSKRRCLWG